MTYRLTVANELEMDFRAESDRPTPVALTNHAYWNLSGDLRRPVHDHTLRVAASRYLALGPHQVSRAGFASLIGLVCSPLLTTTPLSFNPDPDRGAGPCGRDGLRPAGGRAAR